MKRDHLLKIAIFLTCLALLIPIGVYAWTGTFTRYLADDYCFSAALKNDGFWTAQWNFYQTTSSRYPVIFLIGLSEFFGDRAITILPALAIIAWVASLWYLLRSLPLHLPRGSALAGALLIVFICIFQAPNRLQSIYWRSGMPTYTLPLILLCFLSGWMIHLYRRSLTGHKPGILTLLTVTLLAWIAGGCSETYAALQTGLFAMGITAASIWLKAYPRRSALKLLIPALVGALAAMLILFISPANTYRMAYFPEHPTLPVLIFYSLRHALAFVFHTFKDQPLPVLYTLALPAFFTFALGAFASGKSAVSLRRFLRWAEWVPVVTYLLMVCIVAPSMYAQSAYPENRALIEARFILTSDMVVFSAMVGWILGRGLTWLGRRRQIIAMAGLILIVLAAFYPLRAAWNGIHEAETDRAWAQAWDIRDEAIRTQIAAGKQEIIVTALDSRSGLMEMGEDPSMWVNTCAGEYYQVRTIKANLP